MSEDYQKVPIFKKILDIQTQKFGKLPASLFLQNSQLSLNISKTDIWADCNESETTLLHTSTLWKSDANFLNHFQLKDFCSKLKNSKLIGRIFLEFVKIW